MENTFNWIKKCINSCTDNFHLECCKTLMQLFEIQFGESAWLYNSKLVDVWLTKEMDIKNDNTKHLDEKQFYNTTNY